MFRLDLLAKLQVVAPALSDKELIPVLTHFWFQGDTVMAFNDQIAIETNLKTNFTGAVPGKTLMDLLEASRAERVKFELKQDNLHVTAARTKIDLRVLPTSDFVFEMPKVAENEGLTGSPLFLPAIEACMQSISNDTSIPDQLGLTIIPNGKTLDLFATNNATLSYAKVKVKTDLPGRIILSKPFCQQFLQVARTEKFRLLVDADCVMVVTKDVKLFGRLIDSGDPLDFDSILDEHLPKGKRPQMYEMPSNLKYVLQRALIIAEAKMHETKSLIKMQGGKMIVESKSSRGEMTDSVMDEKKKLHGHPDISVRLSPRLLRDGLDRYDRLLVTKTCAVMTHGEDMVYLVSASND